MVTVIASVIGGVLVGLMPALMVSERSRLLRSLRAEIDMYRDVTDDEAAATIAQTLRRTALQYEEWASQSKTKHALHQLKTSGLPAALVAAILVIIRWRGDEAFDRNEAAATACVVAVALLGVFIIFLGGRWIIQVAFEKPVSTPTAPPISGGQ